MRKPSAAKGREGAPQDWKGDSTWVEYPNLGQFLWECEWDDKTERVPGSVTVFVQDGRLKACLSDKALGRVLFVTAQDWPSLLALMDEQLVSDLADWRKAEPPVGRRR